MASQRYPQSHSNSRDDSVRLPSLKDLNFDYQRGHRQDADPTQDNSPRQSWGRSAHQQLTPPLSAAHDAKIDYPNKQDNAGFMTPGLPLSAQSTLSVNTTGRADDQSSKRSKKNMRDGRTYPPQYPSYPPPQPPPNHYQQVSTSSPPSTIDHTIHPYAYQQQYMAPRMYPQHPPPPQPPAGNPYPSPGPPPAPPLQGPWEQPPAQHHPPPPPPPPQHPQYPQHVSTHHPPPAQHLHMHPQHHQHHPPPQPQAISPPPPPPHHSQHPQQQHQHQQHQQPQQHQNQQQHHQQQQPQHPHHVPHSQAQVQPPIQQQQLPFARTTAIVPTTIDNRNSYPVSDQPDRLSAARDTTMSEIVRHCQALYSFANHYAQLQPNIQPTQLELVEMSQRAVQVVRLLEEYRRANLPEAERVKIDSAVAMTPPDDHRPPKRPWEDLSQDGNVAVAEAAAPEQYPNPVEKPQSTAEQDMEIIRSKRATSAVGGAGAAGQPKSKYRKRSRATPPGKCHSCNIRETPEWRRGPDGARTLCNACGLHYAKLMRKSNKIHGAGGDAPRIDMDTLRASARAADLTDKPRSKRSQQSAEPTSPMESAKPLPQQHHQGSFQVVTMMPQTLAPSNPETNRVQPQHTIQTMPQSTSSMAVPPPPWATAVPPTANRTYAPDQLQHQSFIRSSQQHATVTHTSPR